LVGLLIGTAAIGGIVAANGAYDLTVADAVETPSQTVEFEGDNYEIDAFAVREPGASFDVEVTVAGDEDFRVDLYNAERQVEIFRSGSGNESVTFDGGSTDGLSPGSYSLVLNVDSNIQALHPIVISGYDIETTLPDEATTDDTVDINASVTPTELEDDPSGVEIVFWNDDRVERFDASQSDGTYTATVDLSGFDTGEYNVHAAALGDEEFRGEPEILGLSEQQTIDVADGSDDTDSGGQPVSSGPGGGGLPTAGNNSDDGTETDSTPTETAEIVDEAPDEPGVQVSFENTTARSVTLSNETATGTISVTDRSGLPDGASAPAGSTVATVEITVPDSQQTTSATIEFGVDADSVTDPDQLTVERYDSETDTWTQLETTVSGTTDETITVVAETPGFSIFAVTEPDGDTAPTETPASGTNGTDEGDAPPTTDTTASPTPDQGPITPSDPDGQSEPEPEPEDQPGFGVVVAVCALLLAAGLSSRRR
jgi:PGF-pre-PGF domain-containing protein/PGF-CTERM protein